MSWISSSGSDVQGRIKVVLYAKDESGEYVEVGQADSSEIEEKLQEIWVELKVISYLLAEGLNIKEDLHDIREDMLEDEEDEDVTD
jgi:hypothetical protein